MAQDLRAGDDGRVGERERAPLPADTRVPASGVDAPGFVSWTLRPHVALVTGFAIVFALWLAWGYQLTRSLERIEEHNARMYDAHMRGEQTLMKVRTNVLLGSIYLRDAIIDSATPHHLYYREELARLRDEVEQALRSYLPDVTSSVERDHWVRLQTEVAEFWASREIAFADDVPQNPGQAAALLRQRVVPRRDTVLEVLDQLSALQAAGNRRRQADTLLLYRRARVQLLSMGGITIGVAIIVAVMVSVYMAGLQRQIERQRAAEQQNREDLQRLSARLLNAQESERQNLARELHDGVGQALTAVKMDIGIALRSEHTGRVKDALVEARELTESTLRDVRDLSQLLHPSALDDFGLPATLTTYLRSFSQRTGIRAQLAETIDDRFTSDVEVAVYRIVQEALNNVARHSNASACTVALSVTDHVLHLTIEDNGGGFGEDSLSAPARRGLGLIGMRERAQGLGGRFVVTSRPGTGTHIAVTLPIALPATAAQPTGPQVLT